jgi:hypothetical protein
VPLHCAVRKTRCSVFQVMRVMSVVFVLFGAGEYAFL